MRILWLASCIEPIVAAGEQPEFAHGGPAVTALDAAASASRRQFAPSPRCR